MSLFVFAYQLHKDTNVFLFFINIYRTKIMSTFFTQASQQPTNSCLGKYIINDKFLFFVCKVFKKYYKAFDRQDDTPAHTSVPWDVEYHEHVHDQSCKYEASSQGTQKMVVKLAPTLVHLVWLSSFIPEERCAKGRELLYADWPIPAWNKMKKKRETKKQINLTRPYQRSWSRPPLFGWAKVWVLCLSCVQEANCCWCW